MTVRIITGDCRDVLRTLPDESVHCVVTSPPYWGLRDYQIAPSIWGGEPGCMHNFECEEVATEIGRGNWAQGVNGRGEEQPGGVAAKREPIRAKMERGFCRRCNAWRGAHGLEPDYQLYVENAVTIFREVWRVLRKDGTCWVNMGDSYNTGTTSSRKPTATAKHGYWENPAIALRINANKTGLKPKDLIGIPWRVAFALQADGWWLRQDIIWSKPNPMPESVTDRCTKAHEYLFLLSKSERYHFDQEAIKEFGGPDMGPGVKHGEAPEEYDRLNDRQDELHSRIGRKGNANGFRGGSYVNGVPGPRKRTGNVANDAFRRNKRSVWTVATAPYAEAHFATFPPALIEPCIKAGCPPGGMVLDPFFGAGTTGLVCDRLQRNCIGIEKNESYAVMARRRITDDAPLLSEVAE